MARKRHAVEEPPATPRETFRRLLPEVRRRMQPKGWSQRRLAEEMSARGMPLDHTSIAKIENGKRDVSLDEALAICAALEVSPVHMFIPRHEGLVNIGGTDYRTERARAFVAGTEPMTARNVPREGPDRGASPFHREVSDIELRQRELHRLAAVREAFDELLLLIAQAQPGDEEIYDEMKSLGDLVQQLIKRELKHAGQAINRAANDAVRGRKR